MLLTSLSFFAAPVYAEGPFHHLRLEGNLVVQLVQGAKEGITVGSAGADAPAVVTALDNDTLKVSYKSSTPAKTPVQITITYNELASLRATGLAGLRSEAPLALPRVELILTDCANVKLALQSESAKVEVLGGGNCVLTGDVGTLLMLMRGEGYLNASELRTAYSQVRLSGTGKVSLRPGETNTFARLEGNGEVLYTHKPPADKFMVSTNGKGRLRQLE